MVAAAAPGPAGATTYRPDEGPATPLERNESFQMLPKTMIIGGFLNGGTVSDPENNITILSGDLLGDDDPDPMGSNFVGYEENSYHVLRFAENPLAPGDNPQTIVEGFTIIGGNANEPGLDCLDLDDLWRTAGGGATLDGGAEGGYAYADRGPQFVNCRFVGNRAIRVGGAIGGINVGVTLRNCEFEGNQTTSLCDQEFFPADGGGAVSVDGIMDVVECTFVNNVSSGPGGALENPSNSDLGPATSRIVNCRFLNNQADKQGGGVYLGVGDGYLVNCLFAGNTSLGQTTGGGGGLFSPGLPDVSIAGYATPAACPRTPSASLCTITSTG